MGSAFEKGNDKGGSSAAGEQCMIQAQVAGSDKKPEKEGGGAMQVGARKNPEPPLPQQHQPNPGDEAKPDPAYEAPFYKGSGEPMPPP